jgi:uncharacterized protein involved in response to NO
MENSKTIKSIIAVQDFLSILLLFFFYKIFIVDKNANIWAVSLFFLYVLANILFNFKYRMADLSTRNKIILWTVTVLPMVLGLVAVFWRAK